MSGPALFAAPRARAQPPKPRTDGAGEGVHGEGVHSSSTTSAATAASSRATAGSTARAASDVVSMPLRRATGESFAELGLPPWLVTSASALGMRQPTPIQTAAIPSILAGRDFVGTAQTGSGKTAAFALPILSRLAVDPYGPFALILTPSRELALQIAEQFVALGAPIGVRVSTVVGGLDIVSQGTELSKRPHIIVATPGRLAHHIALRTAPPDFSYLAFLVLDEADRLLEPAFGPDLDVILQALNAPARVPRQSLLFSATVAPDVLAAASSGDTSALTPGTAAIMRALTLRSPAIADVAAPDITEAVTVSSLLQQYVFMPAAVKNAYLWHVLTRLLAPDVAIAGGATAQSKAAAEKKAAAAAGRRAPKPRRGAERDAMHAASGESASASASAAAGGDEDEALAEAGQRVNDARSVIVFTGTTKSCQLVCEMLIELGIPCVALHSVMPQHKRLASLAKFRSSLVRVLVATDVASRGLDIPTVDLVINYDLPLVPSDYVHRVGRTARAGRGGRALSLVTQYDVGLVTTIENEVLRGKKLTLLPGLEEEEVLLKLSRVTAAYHLARNRLEERGFEDSLDTHVARKREAKERTRAFVEAATKAGAGRRADDDATTSGAGDKRRRDTKTTAAGAASSAKRVKA